MTIILFILVLVALIVVHEFGHFVVAKLSGMRVDEFGIGYPPRALIYAKKGDTEYTLNWLPFGGFVKIYGEDEGTEEGVQTVVGGDAHRAFGARPRILQALVLVAGIAMNLLFAYILIATALAIGIPRSLAPEEVATAQNVQLLVTNALPGSPADTAGLLTGDEIMKAQFGQHTFSGTDAEAFSAFIAGDTEGAPIEITVIRDSEQKTLIATPIQGIVASDVERPALGVAIAVAGIIREDAIGAVTHGASVTWNLTKDTTVGLVHFFAGVFTLSANLSEVSGPVGIAGAVGNAGSHGLAPLLMITAIISINLALINLLPFPALDGGRLLFVIIESIIRRPLPATFGKVVNGIGFLILVLLMLVITAHDIFKLFG